MGRSRDELSPGYRCFPVDCYVVYYRIVSGGIAISHVLHGTQDVSTAYFPVLETTEPS